MNLRPIIIHLLKKRYGLKCWYCGISITGKRIHIDHIRSKKAGGSDTVNNFALACQSCNLAKGSKSVREFFRWVSRLRDLPQFPVTDAFDEDYLEAKLSNPCKCSTNQHELETT